MKTYQKTFLLCVIFIAFSFSLFAQCMNDVACYMNEWRNESNAVVHFIVPNPAGGNSKTCTGTLINNEARNGRPYIITACHCIDTDGQSGISQAERNNTANYIFSFRFRSSNCDGSQLDNQWQITGAVFRMAHQASDIALIELNQQPPFDINYMGWNVSSSLPANTTVIHHENSQRQKISFSNNTTAFTGNHYQVNYHSGATKGGSSGAAGFNATHQITGVLSFGINGCSTVGQVLPDYYGRLSAAWLGGGTADTQLRAWLSPNQNLQSMSHLIPSLISGTEQLCAGTSTTYTLPNLIATMNATWTVSGNLTILSQNRSSVTVTPASASSSGIGTITATVGGIASTKTIQVNLPVSNQGVTIRNTSNNTQWSSTSGGNLTMCYGQPNYLQVTYAYGSGATNAEWTFPSGWSYSSQYGTSVGVTPYSTGYGNLTVKIANSCGWALYPVGFGVNVNHCYSGFSAGNSYIVYPNPTDDVLNVEFENTEELPEEIALFNSVGEKVAEADMKQKAKDMEFKAKKKITFDVRKLPKGTYYLHIVSKDKVDKKQILIGISSSTTN